MYPVRFFLVRVVLSMVSLCAAASGLEIKALSSHAANPQSTPATSASHASTASGAPSTTTLSLISAGTPVTSIAAGTAVTLTAQVTLATTHAAVTPGLVIFCDATAARCEDSAIVGMAQLTSDGIATFKLVPRIGSHSYQAVFVGTNASAKSSSGTAALAVTGKQSTMTTLTSTGPLDDLMLSATVVGTGVPAPTSTVAFKDKTTGTQLGTATLSAPTQTQSFALKTFNSGDYDFYNMLLVDVNGDGIKDLVRITVEPDGPANFVKVQPGKGDGTFGTATILYAGVPESVVAGDFNADGITDLAVGSNFAGEAAVTVFLGQGKGTFKAQTPIVFSGTHIGPLSLVTADVNGDGTADLVAGLDSKLTVLLGTGSGTFVPQTSTDVSYTVLSLYTADFNGDGVPDLIVMNQGGGGALAYLGSASGAFTFVAEPDTNATAVSIADFNGDGIPDLALVDYTADSVVTVALGNGDGTFTIKSTPAANYVPNAIVAADFNGDGIQDLAVSTDVNTFLLLGNGDGTFAAGPVLFSTSALYPTGLAAADLNGDGLSDLLAFNQGSTIAAALNQATETATATLSGITVASSPTQYATAAYAGDTDNAPSTSASLALSSSLAATKLQLTSAINPSVYGKYITLTAILSPYSLPGISSNGDLVTFYSAGASIGTGALFSGVATLKSASLPVGTENLTAVFGGDSHFAGATSNVVAETVTAGSGSRPSFVVTVNTDDATANQYNCIGAGTANCSLRDAIAAAMGADSGNITFSPTVFAASQPVSARTITLNAVLIIPSNTTITGPTSGSGATLTQLVTVTPLNDTAFEVDKGIANVAISGLSISGANLMYGVNYASAVRTNGELTISNSAITGNSSGSDAYGAPAVFNDASGVLTLTACNISSNYDGADGGGGGSGGGIYNQGVMVITGSTISGNAVEDSAGAGILNGGTATLTNTTVSGNQVLFYNTGGKGGGIYNATSATLNLIDSSVTGNGASNPGDGSGIYNVGTLHITSSSIKSNLTNYNESYDYEHFPAVEDDCDGPGCPPEQIPAPPVFTPPSGTYVGVVPTLTDTTPGTVFFYTTDGSTPTTSSTLIANEPLYLSGSGVITVKAIAFANGESSAVATAIYTLAGVNACTLIDYSNGFTPAALTLNGGATVSGGLLRLTDGGLNEARSAFYSMPVPTTGFTTDFQFQLLYPLADGITFTIQSSSPNAVGQFGGGLGYAGIPKSVALKFDLFNNAGEGFDSTGYYYNGAYPSTPALNLSPYGINLHSGHVFAVHINYVGQVTTATITDLANYQSYSSSIPGDLTKLVGNSAYVGFTGGTGLLTATQNVLTWTYGGGSGCATSSAP